jgi:2-polyprenyl-3-methyl-5-hydroxy-6-metoxy-1,4-benzoquinol methylase
LSGTVTYYDRNAAQYFSETVGVDMSALYAPFLALIPPGGRILDTGCGSGRDSLYFLQHGYDVEAFDASAETCRLASGLIGRTVLENTFEEIDSDSEFDGVWACASLLHVCRGSTDAVLQRLCRALRPGGIMFVSFKFRDGEWEQDGRFFNGYDESSFRALLMRNLSLALYSSWVSNDARPDRRHGKWLNALLRRVGGA